MDKAARVKAAFPGIEEDEFLSTLKAFREKVRSLDLSDSNSPSDITSLARRALPNDDSCFRWSQPGAGRNETPKGVLEQLFHRFVTRYERQREHRVKSDQELWSEMEKHLSQRGVAHYLRQATIQAPLQKYTFKHAWQNGCPRIVVPVSLDAETQDKFGEKATKWAGQIGDLQESEQDFRLHVVLGKPTRPTLIPHYSKALSILKRRADSARTEIVPESEVTEFTERIDSEILAYTSKGRT